MFPKELKGKEGLQQALAQYGDYNIDKVRIVRRPLHAPWIIRKIGQYIGGKKDLFHHDDIFHVFTEMAVSSPDGKRDVIRLEKHPIKGAVYIKTNNSGGLDLEGEHEEAKEVNIKGGTTFREYVENGKTAHNRASSNYFNYDLFRSNCQNFTMLNAVGNNILNSDIVNFINQSADKLMPNWIQRLVSYVSNFQ